MSHLFSFHSPCLIWFGFDSFRLLRLAVGLSSLIRLGCSASKLQGSTCLCLPDSKHLELHLVFLCFMWVLGVGLGFPSVHSKHFTNWTLFLACNCILRVHLCSHVTGWEQSTFKVHISSMINPVQQESSSSSKLSGVPSHSQEEPELFIWQKKKKRS